MTAARRGRVVTTALFLLAAVVFSVVAQVVTVSPAQAEVGLGGGTKFLTGSIFPFVSGEQGRIETAMYVQNLGEETAEVGLKGTLPSGIEAEPLIEGGSLELGPGQMRDFPFAINVSEAVPPGEYNAIITLSQLNVERDEDVTGSLYIPAISGNFVVQVVGASASVTIEPVSDATGAPALGQISLFYLSNQPNPLLIDSREGTSLSRDVVPGRYRATFDVPGLQRQELDFDIGPDDDTTITMEIPTVSIDYVDARPSVDAEGDIVTAELLFGVTNSLRRIDGPITFGVDVFRAGDLVESVTLAELAELPPGQTRQRASYRPLEGFSGGTWEFVFTLNHEDFSIEAANRPTIEVPGIFQSNWEYFALALAALLLIAFALPRRWWLVIFRRRRHEEQSEPEEVGLRA